MDPTHSDAQLAPHPAEQPTSKCYLLTIPPEVRDSILNYLLVAPVYILYSSTVNNLLGPTPLREASLELAPGIFQASGLDASIHTTLAIAGACKQLSWEAIPIYYGKNRFIFGDMECLYRFLKNSGQDRISCIKDITFRLSVCNFDAAGHTSRKAMRLLGQCGALNKLTVNVNWECGMPHNLLESPGVRKLRELRRCKNLELILERRPDTYFDEKMEEHLKTFAEILRKEICKVPDTEIERGERLAKEKAERRHARFERMDSKWQAALRKRV